MIRLIVSYNTIVDDTISSHSDVYNARVMRIRVFRRTIEAELEDQTPHERAVACVARVGRFVWPR